ncbi:MAG: bifunctional riboflavin kinase/FAD synthetase [Calditrichaceae bacterium]|nr:bifunctional riboflavin kinase/FAD synthetase [Calditrichaceae bacterium]HES60234.1 bifunctional riboflavin kinase/FAD synthetase [Caldithrix sp.]
MEIISGLEYLKSDRRCAVTIGTFDGLHLGHKKIIEKLNNIASEKNLCSTLLTFDPHPKIVLKQSDDFHIAILTTLDEKKKILTEMGINRLVVIEFNRAFASQSYEQFVKHVLIEKIGAQAIVVGYDHAFGKDRKGNFDNLKLLCDRYSFDLHKVDPIEINGEIISSSLIRRAISEGDVVAAGKYLGRYYSYSGKVIPGDSRGKGLHFPTANIYNSNQNKQIPASGVYAVDVVYKDSTYKGMLNIGNRPTFGLRGDYTIEVHIHNFDNEIYNENLTVFFKKRLRNEIKFDSVDALVAQLEIDKQNSLKL